MVQYSKVSDHFVFCSMLWLLKTTKICLSEFFWTLREKKDRMPREQRRWFPYLKFKREVSKRSLPRKALCNSQWWSVRERQPVINLSAPRHTISSMWRQSAEAFMLIYIINNNCGNYGKNIEKYLTLKYWKHVHK